MPGNRFKWNSYDDENLVCAFDMSTRTPGGLMKNLARTGAVYDGTINGVFTPANPLIRAKSRPCMDFGGVNEFLNMVNPISGLGTFTVICWVNMDAVGACLFCNQTAPNVYGFNTGLARTQFIVTNLTVSPNSIQPHRTFMFAGVFNGNRYLYLDGKLAAYNAGGANVVDANMFIGQFFNGALRLNGRMDNIMFYNTALSQPQIQSIRRSGG